MLINGQDPNKDIREKALKHLKELCLKSIAELRDIPELKEPTDEQKEWVIRNLKRRFR